MKTNGIVHRVAEGVPRLERWEARCLLCARLPGRVHFYGTKKTAELGIRRHLRVIHDLKAEERLVEER
jgi:hypothetical protein